MEERDFKTTSWTVVLAAKDEQSSVSRAALATLCETYWRPLYSYVRHRGHGVEDAQDLTQSFFARFLEDSYLKDVAPDRGRFRSFLLAALRHFLSKEWDKQRARKRGGGQSRLPFDFSDAESRYALGPSHGLAPDVLFDAEWARAVIESALEQMRAEFAAAGKGQTFEALECCLLGGGSAVPYAELAPRLGLSEGAVKVAVHRMRKHFGALLRFEVAKTVDDPDEVDEELKYLIRVAGS